MSNGMEWTNGGAEEGRRRKKGNSSTTWNGPMEMEEETWMILVYRNMEREWNERNGNGG